MPADDAVRTPAFTTRAVVGGNEWAVSACGTHILAVRAQGVAFDRDPRTEAIERWLATPIDPDPIVVGAEALRAWSGPANEPGVESPCDGCDGKGEVTCGRCDVVPPGPKLGRIYGLVVNRRLLAQLAHHPLANGKSGRILVGTIERATTQFPMLVLEGEGWRGYLMPRNELPEVVEYVPVFDGRGGAA